MDLERKLLFREVYQWENGKQLHQTVYEVYEIPGSNMVEMRKVPGTEQIINTSEEVPQGYTKSFRE